MKCRALIACLFLLLLQQPALAAKEAVKTAIKFDPLLTQRTIRSSPVSGCTTAVPHDTVLTLADVASFALCNNPLTRQSWAAVLGQAARLGISRSAYLPTIDSAVGFSRNRSKSGGFTNSNSTATPAVSLNYLLLDFGGRAATIEVTKQSLFAADYSHNDTLQNVLFSAIQAYYQLYSAEAAVAAAVENLKSTQASLDAATLRYKVGVATIADQLQAETINAQALLRKEQADNQLRINKGSLANVMGLSPDYRFTIDTSAPKELEKSFSNDIATLLAEARKNRPDIAAREAQLQSARANVRLQKVSSLPTVTVSASGSHTNVTSGNSLDRDDSSIAATLRIPLFTGFNRSYQIQAARADLELQKARLSDTENAALLDVWRTYNNFQTTRQTLKMTDSLLASATKSQQVSLERYRAGVGNITELLSAQSQLADARQQQVQSRYNWLIAKADMLRALGQLNKDTVKNQ